MLNKLLDIGQIVAILFFFYFLYLAKKGGKK